MLSPRLTAGLAAVLVFCGVDIGLGFFGGETFSSSFDGWGIARIASVVILCSAGAILGCGYVKGRVPPAKPRSALFALVSALSLAYCIEISAMWAAHCDGTSGGLICLPYHRVEFIGNEVRIFSYPRNFVPEAWALGYSTPKNAATLIVPDWLPVFVLSLMPGIRLWRSQLRESKERRVCLGCGAAVRATATRCPDCGLARLSPAITAVPRNHAGSQLTLGGKLTILHSLFWLQWILVAFNPHSHGMIASLEPLALAFPLGCVGFIPIEKMNQVPAAIFLFVTCCANSFLVGYGIARIIQGPWKAPRFFGTQSRVESRRAEGSCIYCGYSLRGNVSGRCPECGKLRAD
jgi:predicted RNA-binding Zn-ribbon protein involved in translation (DUF1610 family)